MHYVSISASPRKNMNTAKLLGAAKQTLETLDNTVTHYNLYDLNFNGCKSCFACKKTAKSSYGKCIVKDDLYDLFETIRQSDGLIIGTPIYFQDVSGALRSFLERLLFQNLIYSSPPKSAFEPKMKTALIYTMNIGSQAYEQTLTKDVIKNMERQITRLFGKTSSYKSFETNQLNKYDGIEYTYFNPQERLQTHKTEFPKEMQNVRSFIAAWHRADA
jgi:multimeric flavodoxin WrbA